MIQCRPNLLVKNCTLQLFIFADVQIFILWGFHFTLTPGFVKARLRIYNSIFCRLCQSKMLHLQPNLLYEDKNRFVQRWLELCKLCVTGEEALQQHLLATTNFFAEGCRTRNIPYLPGQLGAFQETKYPILFSFTELCI